MLVITDHDEVEAFFTANPLISLMRKDVPSFAAGHVVYALKGRSLNN